MNAILSAIKDKKKLIFANEARLLKKSFFGFLILSLAFQPISFDLLPIHAARGLF